MRPSVCFVLIALLLTAFVVAVGRAAPKPPLPAPPPPPEAKGPAAPAPRPPAVPQAPSAPAPQPESPAWTEYAICDTADEARQVVLGLARTSVEKYLGAKYGDVGWTPSSDFLTHEGVVRLDAPQDVMVEGEKHIKVTARIELSPHHLEKMQEEVNKVQANAKEGVIWQRLLLAARILAGLVVLALVVAAYIRLEEATRGYYTVLLRLTAGGVVMLAAVGLTFLFQ
jgi:hypothetical protein